MIFDYTQFFLYYSDVNNLLLDPNPPTMYYYKKDYQSKIPPYPTNITGHYIDIDNNKVYVNILNSNSIIFSIPTNVNGILWDNHYHFGIINNFTKKQRNVFNQDVIFFHKTIQDPSKPGKTHKRCFII